MPPSHRKVNSKAADTPAAVNGSDPAVLAAQVQAATGMLKAMAHEGRLLILCTLQGGEMSVSEIERATGLAQATISQHLARMRLENLLACRRDGRLAYYSIADAKVSSLITTLHDLYCNPPAG
ncbi:hypothetical protein AB833_15885 [Chromatiales bacterium (ex Bugula neritina AB1)]|nr:hypothetical protein AB833_15885 [Chromatiales bacterium (ex Bugula neritina AB1)]